MNSRSTIRIFPNSHKAVIAAVIALSPLALRAGDDKTVPLQPSPQLQTNKDIPADFHKYFGQRVNSWRDRARQIAKVDMDADMNQDGMIQNIDPADGGAFEATPPGIILGVGEMTRIIIRLIPYRVDFEGEVVVTLEVEGINRGSKKGEFDSVEDELATMGHIRVWKNKDKKELLLDSRDPTKRVVEFTTQYKTYPYNLPMAVPRYVFVEGVSPSNHYIGDIRLLCTVSHRGPNAAANAASASLVTASKAPSDVQPAPPAKINIVTFRTSFDHILLTVQQHALPKQFINNNNEGVWQAPPGSPY